MAEDSSILEFLGAQIREYGGNVEVDTGLWGLFGMAATDGETNARVRSLLASADFAHDCGLSADEQWMIYFVNTADRARAVHWLEDLHRKLGGEIRPTAPEYLGLIQEIPASAAPHRLAQKLVEAHSRSDLSAGAVRAPLVVRALLDRLHAREPLYFSAFQLLLTHHLVDMIELLRQLIPEDVELKNELVKGSLSRDPFLQSRQAAAAEIHQVFVRFHVVNALDQQKNTAIANPYATYMEVIRTADQIAAGIDGTNFQLSIPAYTAAIRAIRRNIYDGGQLNEFNTHAPWITVDTAHPFRFIKARLAAHQELSPLDGLYMLERAVEA